MHSVKQRGKNHTIMVFSLKKNLNNHQWCSQSSEAKCKDWVLTITPNKHSDMGEIIGFWTNSQGWLVWPDFHDILKAGLGRGRGKTSYRWTHSIGQRQGRSNSWIPNPSSAQFSRSQQGLTHARIRWEVKQWTVNALLWKCDVKKIKPRNCCKRNSGGHIYSYRHSRDFQ